MNNQDNTKPVSRLLVKNTFYNLFTQVFLLFIALWSLPKIVHGLSNEGFGLLSIIWAIIGYFTLLDFGISRANTKFLSETLALNEKEKVRSIFWNSIFITAILGIVSAIVIILITPYLVNNILTIEPNLLSKAEIALILSALSIPFMLVFGNIKGIQMALQRFDIVNIFQSVMGIFQWIGSVFLIWFGYGLMEIIILTVVTRISMTIVAFLTLPRLLPYIFDSINFGDKETLKKLFLFGGWLTISQLISPLFLYLDRIFIGAFLTLSAVAYYSVPQETLSRLLIVPISLTITLFPALSEQSVLDDQKSQASILYSRSLKYLLISVLPLVIIFIAYAYDILKIWVGLEYAENSVLIFQILSVGFLFNALAQIPMTTLHAFNRPDLPAKFHIIELFLMVILNVILIPWIGIIGAAIAWSIRVIVDAALLFGGARGCFKLTPDPGMVKVFNKKSTFQFLLLGLMIICIMLTGSLPIKVFLTVIFFLLYVVIVWLYGFDEDDRNFFFNFYSKVVR